MTFRSIGVILPSVPVFFPGTERTLMNKLFRCCFVIALLEMILSQPAAAVPASGLEVQFLGQLTPTGLPAGISFGGGGNSFERRVDLSGSIAAVGAGVFRQGADDGYAFAYDISDPANIHQIAKLRASDNSAGNEFGDGIAVSGNYVFVGARGDRDNRGAVYMYDVSDPLNVVERKITAFDEAPNNEFGFSLAVDGNRLIVGAPKFSASSRPAAAYVVDFTNPDNLTQTKLAPGGDGGFGESVAISGNYAIVGRSSYSAAFPFAGSAILYDITNPNFVRSKELAPTDAPNYSGFGGRVSISGTKAVVHVTSDPGPTNNAGTNDGAVWAFDFSDWNNVVQYEYGRPVPTFGGPVAPFGRWLELEGNLAIAAAFNEDSARGAVYFHDISNVLDPVELLRLPAHTAGDVRFGIAMAADGPNLLISDQEGRVYLYRVIPEPTAFALISTAGLLAMAGMRRRQRV